MTLGQRGNHLGTTEKEAVARLQTHFPHQGTRALHVSHFGSRLLLAHLIAQHMAISSLQALVVQRVADDRLRKTLQEEQQSFRHRVVAAIWPVMFKEQAVAKMRPVPAAMLRHWESPLTHKEAPA